MYSTDELVQAITIAYLVSSYLLNTNRVQKAIELCKETLFLVNHKTLENMKEFVSWSKIVVHLQMIAGYQFTKDHRNAIRTSGKLLVFSRETGQRVLEGIATFFVAQSYVCNHTRSYKYDYDDAIMYYREAVSIAIETKEKKLEGNCYVNLGRVFECLSNYITAKAYHEKALAIAEKMGHRKAEAKCHGNLGRVVKYLGEYDKAKRHQEKALAIAEKIGDRETEAKCYENIGSIYQSFGEYVKAKEHLQKAIGIAEKIGDRETEAKCSANLGSIFQSLGEYVKAKAYKEKAPAIAEKIGDRKTKAKCYVNIGSIFHSLGEYGKAIEYQDKALAIAIEIGDWETKAKCYANLGSISYSLGEYAKATEYQKKALEIAERNGDKETEATCCEHLGAVFTSVGQRMTAEGYLERALLLRIETGEIERQAELHLLISRCLFDDEYIRVLEVKSNLLEYITKSEVIGQSLKDNDQFKISYFDKSASQYRTINSRLRRVKGILYECLYTEEIGRARALADLMSAQYSIDNEPLANTPAKIDIETMMKIGNDCTCLYISYCEQTINFFVIKENDRLFLRPAGSDNCFAGKGSVSRVVEFFCTEICRKIHCFPLGQCEDRSWFPSNVYPERTCKFSKENSLMISRPLEEDEEEQQPILTLADGYRMIIAPVADFLDKPEIIIVPDRLFFRVPFAALKDERGKYLSESFRIRIVPSLTTLKLIQESPADYHSQTGALIVGDPEVGEVLYKGNLQWVSRLPFASEEAEMVGKLLGTQPLLGKKATKETVLQSIHSVSLIHFAAHGDAERGEIVLAPPPFIGRKPQEEDYLLTMADISQIRLRAKLVVLSCCHSAQGQIKTEGVVGIARAFLGSGARSVLVALWAIQDEATKQFMSRFYEHLGDGESASQSLHQAMKWMRENGFSDEEQWAPFMLVGDNVTLDFQKLRLVETY